MQGSPRERGDPFRPPPISRPRAASPSFLCLSPFRLTATRLVTSLEGHTSAATTPTALRPSVPSALVAQSWPSIPSSRLPYHSHNLLLPPAGWPAAYARSCRPTSSTTRSPVSQSRPHPHEFTGKGKGPIWTFRRVMTFFTPLACFCFPRGSGHRAHGPRIRETPSKEASLCC